jgi:hypothetical protein
MPFRPEEVHGASGIRDVLEPLPVRHSYITHQLFGLCPQNDSIPNLHLDGLSTIKTRQIDLNRLSRKKPADR